MSSRDALSARLTGSGIEVGPGHAPYPTPEHVSVRYVDRLTADEHQALFPEFPIDVGFPAPDDIVDLDVDGLRHLADGSQDFVISSHVIEHLADPIGFLQETHRVLRVGGLTLILLPDRRTTFDHGRAPTTLQCLIRDHETGATEPDDEHVLDFLVHGDQGPDFVMPDDPAELAQLIQWHRDRSIHVHCWTEDEFPHVIEHCMRELGQGWELVDQRTTAETAGFEFGYLLRRSAGSDADRFVRNLHAARQGTEHAHGRGSRLRRTLHRLRPARSTP
jgi:SAM-dependent methyltransferase